MQGPKCPLFYSHVDLVWSLLIVGTGFVPWVELPVQMRLCPIFMSGVGLPTSTSIPRVERLSTDPRVLGRHSSNMKSHVIIGYNEDKDKD